MNNNLNPLPWYDSIDKQDRNKWYANGEIFGLPTPNTNLLPFQIRRRRIDGDITAISVKLHNCNGILVSDITSDIVSGGLTIEPINDYFENIIYRASSMMADNIQQGYYYAVLSDGVNTWYSEVFKVVPNIEEYIKIEYWDVEDQEYDNGDGAVIYTTGYRNILYIKGTICRPAYDNEDESQKRDGYIFTEKKVSKKTFTFSFYAPEYLTDALRLPYLSDFVRIYANGEEYKVFDFLATPKWFDSGYGHYADVVVDFEVDTILKKIQPISSLPLDIHIYGRAYIEENNMPLQGVSVTLRTLEEDRYIATVKTDRSGYFSYRWFINEDQYPGGVSATFEYNLRDKIESRQYEDYLYAVRRGIRFDDVYMERSKDITCEWGNFVNILRETGINAYSTAYSKAYNDTLINYSGSWVETDTDVATTLTVDKKLDGISIYGYPKSYSILDAFSIGGNDYPAITSDEWQKTAHAYIEDRIVDFKAYIDNIETMSVETTQVNEPFRPKQN